MKPDLKNTWMESQIGPLEVQAPSAEKGSETSSEGTQTMSRLENYVLALTRIVFALLFACHGAQKLFGAFGGHFSLHNPWFLTAGLLEFGGAS